MSDAIVDTWRDGGGGDRAARQVRAVPGRSSRREGGPLSCPGPTSHPYPGVSTRRASRARRRAIPDRAGCPTARTPRARSKTLGRESSASTRRPKPPSSWRSSRLIRTNNFQALRGTPAPRTTQRIYAGLEEDVTVHLQAFRLGDILYGLLSARPTWFDQPQERTRRGQRVGTVPTGPPSAPTTAI